ncbi:hypothetical protein GLOIN_2v1692826 [Rhizophagus irregularis DAOM 181602=DAOM 197198]|uniref:Uncharacterized protein n=1 Tax=Rhizophagus irregularis (strain DAOM 181602 / DAOM 197198 / MUCL 43194) TaxID=747089 RepID=A0A2P4PBM0_RHIID|nr:hypothetical protein GLOIN_2v1692826 [Rhizophagus irregularis DAOM 181602=DAOM 197198]POG62794.1 hypothetical protein GLOIN_2v1692826 [Rhizophagus irregularis DAOM 181602=DAOM 197198]|eukprot:XP_025169660.1 hypothetical protein GLOIN_2v1692826 [Rhizophagus irregularis DAOM 181602=DAOM 197198]
MIYSRSLIRLSKIDLMYSDFCHWSKYGDSHDQLVMICDIIFFFQLATCIYFSREVKNYVMQTPFPLLPY